MSRHRHIHAKSEHNELTVQDHESDAPVVPIAQLERLHNFRPDRVDWIFQQTELEAQARRKESHRVNTFIFIERIMGMFFGFALACIGLAGSIWLASEGKEIAAGIGGATLATLVSVFILRNRTK